MTVTGTGFLSGAAVDIGGAACTGVIVGSTTDLTCSTGSNFAGAFDVTVTNADTQLGILSSGYTYEAPPTPTSVSPTGGATAGGTVVTLTGTGFKSGAAVRFANSNATSVIFVNSTTLTAHTPAHATAAVDVTVTNPSGITGVLTNGYNYGTVPTVTAISPAVGPTGGGTSVTITGTNFPALSTVTVGGVAATGVTIVNATTITATTPSGSVGAADVTVTTPTNIPGTLSSGYTYTAQPAPTITSLSPNTGATGGGTPVTITGTGFVNSATVTFGITSCNSIVVVSSTSITCTTPSGSAGAVDVTVTNPDTQFATSSGGFTYMVNPTVASVSPNIGPLAGGTSVTVTGTGFVAGSAVSLGGSACTGITVVNATTITCTTSSHAAGTVNAVVNLLDGRTGSATNAFSYVVAPTLFGVYPAQGSTAGGTTITLLGTNFISGATVKVNGVSCTGVTFVSANVVTAVTPSASAGTYDVVLKNPDTQTGTLANGYTYGSLVFANTASLAGPLHPTGFADGAASATRFNGPYYATTDNTYVYVSESTNNTIRKVAISNGATTTLAGTAGLPGCLNGTGSTARFTTPAGLAYDGTYIYVADYGCHVIRKVDPSSGAVTTIAGLLATSGETDDLGSLARLTNPVGLAYNSAMLYFTEANHTVRSVNLSNDSVVTIAGQGGNPGTTDNTGTLALFRDPLGIDTDGTNLYVADSGNHTIRQIVLGSAVVTTLAGTVATPAYTDANGTSAAFSTPAGVFYNGGNLYIADSGNNAIRKLVLSGHFAVSTYAGGYGWGYTDGVQGSDLPQFNDPFALTSDGSSFYITDSTNQAIRTMNIGSNTVATLVGVTGVNTDVNSTGTASRFNNVKNVTTDGTNTYVADCSNHVIRQVVNSSGVTTDLAGLAGTSGSSNGTGSAARFSCPAGITNDGTNLYVTDSSAHTIRKIVISTALVSTLAGVVNTSGINDGTGTGARFNTPSSITTTGAYLYVADYGNHNIRQVDPNSGAVLTIAGTGSAGSHDDTGTLASFNNPVSIATDGTNLYVVDKTTNIIRQVTISGAVVTTLAGTASVTGFVDANGPSAAFNGAQTITTDGLYLYVGDANNAAFRAILISTGDVSTILGRSGPFPVGDVNGSLASSYIIDPQGFVFQGATLYFSNSYNIRTAH